MQVYTCMYIHVYKLRALYSTKCSMCVHVCDAGSVGSGVGEGVGVEDEPGHQELMRIFREGERREQEREAQIAMQRERERQIAFREREQERERQSASGEREQERERQSASREREQERERQSASGEREQEREGQSASGRTRKLGLNKSGVQPFNEVG